MRLPALALAAALTAAPVAPAQPGPRPTVAAGALAAAPAPVVPVTDPLLSDPLTPEPPTPSEKLDPLPPGHPYPAEFGVEPAGLFGGRRAQPACATPGCLPPAALEVTGDTPSGTLCGQFGCGAPKPFSKGSWMFDVTGGAAFGTTDGYLAGTRVTNAWYFRDGLALLGEVPVYWGRVSEDDPFIADQNLGGASLNGGFRKHFVRRDNWSLFADVLVGLSVLSKSMPAGGTNFNFVLTGGMGGTRQLSDRCHLIAGVRYFHLSNGSFFRTANPGYDAIQPFAGLMFQYR